MLHVKDLQLQSIQELHEALSQKREELRVLRFSVNGNQLKNVRAIRSTRQDIARLLGTIRTKRSSSSV